MKTKIEYKVSILYESDEELNKEHLWDCLANSIEHERVNGCLTDIETSASSIFVEVL